MSVSYFAWQSKLQNITQDVLGVQPTQPEQSDAESNPDEEKMKEELPSQPSYVVSTIRPEITERMNDKLAANQPIRFLFVGSQDLAKGSPSLTDLFTTQLSAQLGNLLSIEKELVDSNIQDFFQSSAKEIDLNNYDFILFEPFMNANHGVLSYEDSQLYLLNVLQEWRAKDPGAVIIVHPSSPTGEVGKARYQALIQTMNSSPEIYIDPWQKIFEQRPEFTLNQETLTLDETTTWANQLVEYFIIAEEEESND